MRKKFLGVLWLIIGLIQIEANELPSFVDNSFIDISEKAISAVVFIAIEENVFNQHFVQNPDSYYASFPFAYEFFRPLYENFWPAKYCHGSGFFIRSDGYIVTNAHVVEKATCVFVSVQGAKKRIYKANVLGKDLHTDLAVLKIETEEDEKFVSLQFGDSNKICIGEQVAAIGTPTLPELEATVTTGIISGKNRSGFCITDIEGYIQTDTSVNKGNSGGPLLNLKGEVIGIITWGFNHFFDGLNFAIPSHTASHIVEQLIKKGMVSQGFLGVELIDDKEIVFDRYQFGKNKGVRIQGIIDNTPAYHAGLQKEDCIIAINEFPIRSLESLRNYLYVLAPDTEILLKIERESSIHTVLIKLEKNELIRNFSPFISLGCIL